MHGPLRRLPLAWLALLAAPMTSLAARPEPTLAADRPDPATVQRFGPAYRYPRAGWVVVHVEGSPYERGYQHGRLLAPEIADYVKALASNRSRDAPADAWRATRTTVNALFLRRYDREYLEEMKGIADGASSAGAKFRDRPLDLLDIAAVNSDVELDYLDVALDATATGLEGRSFRAPSDLAPGRTPPEHCSAFAANGPATADGKIVFGHITMSGLGFVTHFNVWLDVKPEAGHRVLMQTYPGGIQSGMDYYLNDAGLIVCETTVKQTRFDVNGTPLASRVRKALQYGDSIDDVARVLRTDNNGLYTNEWLLADTKTNEIAMFDLGTHKSKLWRSGKDEWPGGTKGFYWGCNNARDLDVRLETVAGTDGRPSNVVYRPLDRDRAWIGLYERHKGAISAAFGFEAFTTPPIAAAPSCDAKFTTTEMARGLKTWALFGPPLGKTWEPNDAERKRFPDVRPLVGNDWTVLSADPPETPERETTTRVASTRADEPKGPAGKGEGRRPPRPVDLPDPAGTGAKSEDADPPPLPHPTAWHGTILPKADADVWLATAFSDYETIVAREQAYRARAKSESRETTGAEKDDMAVSLFAPLARYSAAVTRLGKDVPLAETRSEVRGDEWYQVAAGKGVLFLKALRSRTGDAAFLKLMDDFGRAHAGRTVSAGEFQAAAEAVAGHDLAPFFREWMTGTGLPGVAPGPAWSIDSFETELDRAVIVYGTLRESDAQREAAGRLQRTIERKWSNVTVPVLPDRDATAEALHRRHVLLVGRPETNSVAGRLGRALPLSFGPSSFVVRGETYAHPLSAVIAAGPNPDDSHSEVVLFAGLSAEATWRCVQANGDRDDPPAEVLLLPARRKARRLVVRDSNDRADRSASR